MDIKSKALSIREQNNIPELLMVLPVTLLMFIQRFLSGGYKPVMDDWFLYGDLYKKFIGRIIYFALPNDKFAIRPFAGLADVSINASLFGHLWIVELILILSLSVGVFFILKTLRRNNMAGAGCLICLVCLYPLGLEATYWIAAATRISYSILFIGLAIFFLDKYLRDGKKKYAVLFSIAGIFAVGFYEPAIVMYILFSVFVILENRKGKQLIFPFAIVFAQVAAIGIYYLINSAAGEITSRGEFITNKNIFEHAVNIWKNIWTIFTDFSARIMENGYAKGMPFVNSGHRLIKFAGLIAVSIFAGGFSAVFIKKRKFSVKILITGIVLFFGGLALNFILNSDRVPLRLVYFSLFGVGIVIDEILMLFPDIARRILCFILVGFFSFQFTIAGIGEVWDYQQTSGTDEYIVKQLIELDTPERITDVDKNTYLFGGMHSYEESYCIHYLEHTRGATANYAELTGCMRHLTDKAWTNNIIPFTYGDIQVMKPYIDTEGLCHFYNIEYTDKTVVKVDLVPDGDDYKIVREDGSEAGALKKIDETRYQFFN